MTIAAVENDGHMDRRVGSLTSKTTNGQNETSGGFLKVIDSALLKGASDWTAQRRPPGQDDLAPACCFCSKTDGSRIPLVGPFPF